MDIQRRTSSHQFSVEVTGLQKPSLGGGYGMENSLDAMNTFGFGRIVSEVAVDATRVHSGFIPGQDRVGL